MSELRKPDWQQWFDYRDGLNRGEPAAAYWRREVMPVIKSWEGADHFVWLRVTTVDADWMVLEGWHIDLAGPVPDEATFTPPPTEADVPVGFA